MSNQTKKVQAEQAVNTSPARVDSLATRALAVVAERNLKNNTHLDPTLATRLRDAAASESADSVPNLVAEMLATGVSPEAIAMLYIPHAARQMGEDWCDDTLSFARVTIGTARLQSSLRTLGTEWASHGYGEETDGKGGVIVIVAKDAFHTLGALVLCGQLRRMGLSVRLAMGATLEDLRLLFLTTQFDAALISASTAESLDSLRKCVDVIRESASKCPPIIIGGNVLDQDMDIQAITGADFVTRDPFEALEHCGLTEKTGEHITLQRAAELDHGSRVNQERDPMTARGTKYWDSGKIPLIAPEMLGDIIAALADIALVIDETGMIRSVITNPSSGAFAELSQWTNRDVRSILRVESIPKFDRALKTFLEGEILPPPMQLNHEDDLNEWGFPVNYTLHSVGPERSILMMGQDLRPIAEMQQQLIKAQMALEQDYEQHREYDTRFRVLMESGRDPIVFISMSTGRIIEANTIAAKILGRDRIDVIGAAFAQEFDGRRKGELMEALNASALAEGPTSVAVETRKGGKTLRLHTTVFRASGERVMLCRLDMNEGEATPADDIPQSMLGLFNRGADAIVFTDADGILLSVNDAFLELTSAAHAANVKGRSLGDYLQRGHVDLRVLLENSARTGQIRLYSTKMSGEFGAPRTVEISATYLDDLEHPGYAFVLRDASRADAARVTPAPAGEENVKSVMELVGSATLKEIVAETTDVVERMCIETAIELTSNNRVAAAEMLGLSRQSLYVKLRKYSLLNKND